MEQVVIDMIREAILHDRLSRLEFILIPPFLQEEYVQYNIGYCRWLPDWVFLHCEEKLKPIILEYKLENKGLSEAELAVCSKEQIEKYLARLISEEAYISDVEIKYFTDEQKTKYLNKKAIEGEYLQPELFMMLDEYHKLRYILMIGLNEVHTEIYEWYTAYEKATNRDKQITNILE